MFGVCSVSHKWYEGSQTTRTTCVWWTGTEWSEDPVYEGPFATREDAQAFANERQARLSSGSRTHYYDYGPRDPFGEDANYYRSDDDECTESDS